MNTPLLICFKRNNCNTLRTLGATWLILKYNKFLFNGTNFKDILTSLPLMLRSKNSTSIKTVFVYRLNDQDLVPSKSSETGITVKPTPPSSQRVLRILVSGLKTLWKSRHLTLFQVVQRLHPFSPIHFDATVNYTQEYFTFIFPFYTNTVHP
jgi:hypothetical protein